MKSFPARWLLATIIFSLLLLLCVPLANAGLFDDLVNSAEKLRQAADDLSRTRESLSNEPAPKPEPENKPEEAVETETFPVKPVDRPYSSNNHNNSSRQVALVQRMLNQLGYNVGPVDGVYGRNTSNGIRRYQADKGLPSNGNVTDELIARLDRDSRQATGRSSSTSQARTPDSRSNPPARSADASDGRVIPAMAQPAGANVSIRSATTETASSATAQYDADGNLAVQAALFAWALSEYPELATSPQLQMAVRQIEGLPGPEERPKSAVGPEVEAYLREVATAAKTMPVPERIRIEIPASLRNPHSGIYGNDGSEPGDLVLSSQTESIEGTAALLRIYRQWPGRSNYIADWVLEKPFYLPLPPDMTLPKRERSSNTVRHKMLLSISLDMSNPVVNLRGSAPHLFFTGVSAQAQVAAVDLVHRTERRSQGVYVAEPDQILASWRGQESAPEVLAPATPVDIPELVALFGGAINAERYVPLHATSSSLSHALGGIAGRVRSSYGPTYAIETALAFSAILDAGGERTLGPEATEIALRNIVSEREKYDLFPVSYLKDFGNMNELQRSSVLVEAEPKLRALVAARAPQLPLKVRSVVTAVMGDYETTLKGFSLHSNSEYLWLPRSPVSQEDVNDILPGFLPMPQDEAAQLLAIVERKNERTRKLYIAVDYTLNEALARPGGSGLILPKELPLIRYMSQLEAVTIYADAELTTPVWMRQYEAKSEGQPKLLPDAIYATTGKSLMGAIGRQPGGRDIVLQAASFMRDVRRAAPEQRDRMAEIITEDILSAARNEYWIGAQWGLGEFDEARGGFVVKSVSFRAVPHGGDISGVGAPDLAIDSPRDVEVLRVNPQQRAVLEPYLDLTKAGSRDGMRLMSFARIRPLGAEQKRGEPILKISAPSELLLGAIEKGGRQWPSTDDNRLLITPPPELGPASGKIPEVIPPDALPLDHEGIDLLAISLAPDAYDSSAYERMLLERLLKEHSFAQSPKDTKLPVSVSWGRFFESPSLSLTESDIRELVPVFRDWTLARAAALPDVVLLPIGGNPHPLTGCQGLNALTQPHIDMNDPFLKANTRALLGPDVVPSERHHNLYGSGRSRAGPDTVLYWNGGGRYGGSQSCKYVASGIRSIDRGIQTQNAPFTSAVIIVNDQPFVSPVSAIPTSFLYRVSVDTLRFVPADELNSPPENLAGFVALTTNVEAAEAYRKDQFGGGYKTVGEITKGDWEPLVATAPVNADILGMTLEMPLADFISAARKRMPTATSYKTVVPGEGIFGYAKGLVEPDTGETLTAIYGNHVKDKPVIALMRRLELDATEVSVEGLKLSLQEKYGPEVHEEEVGEWYWGVLPVEEDTYGYCGGPSVLERQDRQAIPELEAENVKASGQGESVRNTTYWSEFGWPSDFDHQRRGMIPDIEQCTKLIAAKVHQNGRKLVFVTWLFDRALAERLDALPSATSTKAKIDL